jgi:hypothetical protein
MILVSTQFCETPSQIASTTRKLASNMSRRSFHRRYYPHSDHVAEEISTDRRKPEHMDSPRASSNGNTPSFQAFPKTSDSSTLSRMRDRVSDFRDEMRALFEAFQFSPFGLYDTIHLDLQWRIQYFILESGVRSSPCYVRGSRCPGCNYLPREKEDEEADSPSSVQDS